jgi:hypothetical protein
MRHISQRIPISLLLLAVTLSSVSYSAENNDLFATRPLVAIWNDWERSRPNSAPSLRIAIWNDGRILFAKDPTKWTNELLEGHIESPRVDALKKALAQTGIFDLKRNSYLVPDAPVYCMTIDLGNKQRMLSWDERETPGYGINISPTPQDLAFKKGWKEINKLALSAIPASSTPYPAKFTRPPASWRSKESIASE